jgi:hypothetical protein
LFIDFEEAYESVRREVLYDILTEFSASIKLLTSIKMCSNETYDEIRTDNNLFDAYPIQNGLNQEDVL